MQEIASSPENPHKPRRSPRMKGEVDARSQEPSVIANLDAEVEPAENSGVVPSKDSPDTNADAPRESTVYKKIPYEVIKDETLGTAFNLRNGPVSSEAREINLNANFTRNIIVESLDELEALKRSVILSREDAALHQERFQTFEIRLHLLQEHLKNLYTTGKAKKALGTYTEKAQEQQEELIEFYHRERDIFQTVIAQQEQGKRVRPSEIARQKSEISPEKEHVVAVEARMKTDPELIPQYLEKNRLLATAKRERASHTTLLQKRLGEIVPEELDQLAHDPSSISVFRQGWEWLRSKVDTHFLPTTKLLAAYRTKNDEVKAIEREQEARRQFIEHGVVTEPTNERLSPRLETTQEKVTKLLTGSLETPREMDQLVFATHQLQEILTPERARSPYQAIGESEHVLHKAQQEIKRLQDVALADAQKWNVKQPDDLVARELVLFGSPRIAQESRQYTQLSQLFDLNPRLAQAHLSLARIFEKKASPTEQQTSAKAILQEFSPLEQRILVTLTKHWNEHSARVKVLTGYNQLSKTRKQGIDLSQALEKARGASDPVDILQIIPLPIEEIDPKDTTSQARTARFRGDLEKVNNDPQKLAQAYEKFLSIWIHQPLEADPRTKRDHAHLDEAKDALKELFHSHFKAEMRAVYEPSSLQRSIDIKAGNIEALAKIMIKDGVVLKALPSFHLNETMAIRLLEEMLAEEMADLIPLEIRSAMDNASTKNETRIVYEIWNSVQADPDTLERHCLNTDQKTKLRETLTQEGIEEEDAFAIVESIARKKEMERKEKLRTIYRSLSPAMQEVFQDENFLYLSPPIRSIDKELKQKIAKYHRTTFSEGTLDKIFTAVLPSRTRSREDVKEVISMIRSKFQA